MRIKYIQIKAFKRFTDLTVSDLPETARLVVLAGPNGCGKSSLFDAFMFWYLSHAFQRYGDRDESYYLKQGLPPLDWGSLVSIQFHQSLPSYPDEQKKAFYIRSAYRNEPDFTLYGLQKVASPLDQMNQRENRLIDNDMSVQHNYQRLVSSTLEGVYSGQFASLHVQQLADHHIGQLRASMGRVFDDLVLAGIGKPLEGGSFFFEKGVSRDFHYKNLSGGEKAAFDLLLDLTLKRQAFDDTVFCIDEPELHMHTRLQARLLEELVALIPDNCQLWIATHSIGMMRKARELQSSDPEGVVFLDFGGSDFDQPVTLTPAQVNREFWTSTLRVALDDLAQLVAPGQVVLCEGHPARSGKSSKGEFDAECYRTIFGVEYPDTDFISVGNESDVRTDRLEVGKAIQALLDGTRLIRVVDRDSRSPEEVSRLKKKGVRVLSRRHLEAYLMDNEVLSRLCSDVGQPEKERDVVAAKDKAIEESVERGNPSDDIKSATGTFYEQVKRILQLTQAGSTHEAFLRDTLAPRVVPATNVYTELRRDVFDE